MPIYTTSENECSNLGSSTITRSEEDLPIVTVERITIAPVHRQPRASDWNTASQQCCLETEISMVVAVGKAPVKPDYCGRC
ncbi:jg26533 [Pararge aegeria aegeria]|uniref:Jg26533 protein n=1 Tax=Pararge aegeria aegeria TaxID=348720 RepID=A0A8S4RAT5_9NEOP|nr:jg26533 [Pararge aegeria aegeria]